MKLLKFHNARKADYQKRQPIVRRNINFSGGTVIDQNSAMEVSAFFRGVTFIGSQLAKLPIHLKDSKNKKSENDIFFLLNKAPNPHMSSFTFKLWIVSQALQMGNAYVEIERSNTGRVLNLWPILDESVVPYRRVTDGELVYGIYPSIGDGFMIPKEDVLHIPSLHTKDGIVGQGLLGYAHESLGIAKGADKFANSMFSNSGIPSGTLQVPQKLSDEAYNRLEASWREKMGGRKTGGTAILEEGTEYKSISLNPEVMQFLETRKFSVSEIARFLGVSPSKLYDIDAQRYGNVEEDGLSFVNDTLSVWATNVESQINRRLLVGRYRRLFSEFDLKQVFKADMKTRSSYFNTRMQAGSITPNEIRMMEGDEPYEGGDKYYIATNNFTPLDRMDELLDSQIEKGSSDDNDNTKNPAPEPGDTNVESSEEKLYKTLAKYFEKKK